MAFCFVDNSAINDRATRKRMRSHAMAGKNAGRKFYRPSRVQLERGKRELPDQTRRPSKGILEQKFIHEPSMALQRQMKPPFACHTGLQRSVGHQVAGYALPMEFSVDNWRSVHQCAYRKRLEPAYVDRFQSSTLFRHPYFPKSTAALLFTTAQSSSTT
jgi:hypothetical protein